MDGARLLDRLWDRYAAEVPYAGIFVALSGGRFQNDHVAFRSLAREGGGIGLFAPIFERRGWRRAGEYRFPDAHLAAIHLAHPGRLPRIFLSELEGKKLSPGAQAILDRILPDPPPPTGIDDLADWFAAPSQIAGDDLLALEAESQYAAWLLAFGRKVNHFTGAVDDVERWQERMRAVGVPMKPEIEGAPGSVLRQTATAAVRLPIALSDGESRDWPYAYFEIAERRPGFDGFLGPQARQLFDMTQR